MAPITVDPNALSGAGFPSVRSATVGRRDVDVDGHVQRQHWPGLGRSAVRRAVHESRGRTPQSRQLRGQRMPQHRLRGAGQRNDYSRAEGELGYQRPQPAIVSAAVSGTAICAPGSPSATGGGVAEPILWCVVEALIGICGRTATRLRCGQPRRRGVPSPVHCTTSAWTCQAPTTRSAPSTWTRPS